jgi:hypothetical protein
MNSFLKTSIVLLLAQQVAVVQGGLFRNIGTSWLKSAQNEQAVRKCFMIRGGGSDDQKNGEKVKGVCIGIDLGTTYR